MSTADKNRYWPEQTNTDDENKDWPEQTTSGEPVQYHTGAVRTRHIKVKLIDSGRGKPRFKTELSWPLYCDGGNE